MNTELFDIKIRAVEGGVTAAAGFKAAGIHAGFRKNPERLDYALVVPDKPCPGAGVFTTNRFCAAPVQVSRANLGGADKGYGIIAGVSVNSGNANAATGETGLACARETCSIASQVIGCMTTDTHSKEYAVSYVSEAAGHAGNVYTVGGMCKGSGMIMPNMATMIAVITTDAPVEPAALHALLLSTVKQTFNKVTVDSDTSTNDTCIMLASGAAAADAEAIVEGTDAFDELAFAVHEVCESLARNIAADGEGASKLVTVNITGAANDEEADIAARAVANSPLVKTCIAGHDCNWGRVAMALGKCGVKFNQEDVSIDMMGMPVCRDGLTVPFDEDEALRRFEAPEIVISADLGAGDTATTVWTCDLTHEYISINGDYRS